MQAILANEPLRMSGGKERTKEEMDKRKESLSKEMKKEQKEGRREGKAACLLVLPEFSH